VLGGGKTNALLFHTRWRLEFYFILFYFIFHSFKRVGRWQDEKKNCLAIAKEKKSRGKKKIVHAFQRTRRVASMHIL
jgi:hypothetical protein